MADKISKERRSENMRRIRSVGMRPELLVRRLTHQMGYRYRLHVKNLPGRPDLVFSPRQKVIFVHGCFWHQHSCVDGGIPRTNRRYWQPKLEGNKKRDYRQRAQLAKQGWRSLVIWECETKNPQRLISRIGVFLGKRRCRRGLKPAAPGTSPERRH